MKRVVVRPAAAADIEDAYQWYESQQPGLGEQFLAALRSMQELLLDHPESFPVLYRDTRRALIPQRFPYGLFYRIYGDTIVVVALHARPARSASVAASYLISTSNRRPGSAGLPARPRNNGAAGALARERPATYHGG